MYWGKFVASSLVFSLLSKAAAVAQLSLMSITASYVVCVCVDVSTDLPVTHADRKLPSFTHTHTHGWARAHKRTYAHNTQQRNKTVKLAEELFFSAETASEVFAQRPEFSDLSTRLVCCSLKEFSPVGAGWSLTCSKITPAMKWLHAVHYTQHTHKIDYRVSSIASTSLLLPNQNLPIHCCMRCFKKHI